MSFRALPDASKLIYVVSTPTRINDLFVLDRATGDAHATQLTHVNDQLFSKLNLTEPEEIWYDSFDGKHIQAWLQKPPNFDAHKKYPLILNIHGGPHVAYGNIFDHEFQWMAAKGYVIENIAVRSEEHTSELQSHHDLVCRLLLEKKKKKKTHI